MQAPISGTKQDRFDQQPVRLGTLPFWTLKAEWNDSAQVSHIPLRVGKGRGIFPTEVTGT